MLVKHSMNTIIEVLIFAIARGIVAGHEESLSMLIRVMAIALLLFCRKYLFKEFVLLVSYFDTIGLSELHKGVVLSYINITGIVYFHSIKENSILGS